MRNSGDTPEDNRIIQELIKVLFSNVNGLIKKIKNYVDDFNKESHVKLVFKGKWTPLPK
jgi:DNA replication protein DnaC